MNTLGGGSEREGRGDDDFKVFQEEDQIWKDSEKTLRRWFPSGDRNGGLEPCFRLLSHHPWMEDEARGVDEVTLVISGTTYSSWENFLPAFSLTTVLSLSGEFHPWWWFPSLDPSNLFPFRRWLFSVVFHFFLWTNFIAHSLLFSCLGREMLYIKIVIILFYSSANLYSAHYKCMGPTSQVHFIRVSSYWERNLMFSWYLPQGCSLNCDESHVGTRGPQFGSALVKASSWFNLAMLIKLGPMRSKLRVAK